MYSRSLVALVKPSTRCMPYASSYARNACVLHPRSLIGIRGEGGRGGGGGVRENNKGGPVSSLIRGFQYN